MDKITSGGDLLSKVDPYIEVGVRERTQRTRTIWNNKNPDFQEVFNLIIDDPEMQQLTFKLHDDDLGFSDPVSPSHTNLLQESNSKISTISRYFLRASLCKNFEPCYTNIVLCERL